MSEEGVRNDVKERSVIEMPPHLKIKIKHNRNVLKPSHLICECSSSFALTVDHCVIVCVCERLCRWSLCRRKKLSKYSKFPAYPAPPDYYLRTEFQIKPPTSEFRYSLDYLSVYLFTFLVNP